MVERMVMTEKATPAEADETQELLLRIQGGDPQAFDELFARHRAEVHQAVARRLEPSLRSRMDPSDVVQEAQLDAVATADRLHRAAADAVSAVDLADGLPASTEAARQATAARRDIGRDRRLTEADSSSQHGRVEPI